MPSKLCVHWNLLEKAVKRTLESMQVNRIESV